MEKRKRVRFFYGTRKLSKSNYVFEKLPTNHSEQTTPDITIIVSSGPNIPFHVQLTNIYQDEY